MKWRKVKLEKAFALIRNGASIQQTEGKSGVPITRIETISNGALDYSRMGFADVFHGAYQDYYLQEGDILMSHINSWSHLGKCALVEDSKDPVIHGMNLLVLRSDQSQLLPRFANYFFRTSVFKLQLNRIANQSVNQSSFAIKKLKELEMPLPPLSIQKQIADTLDKADSLRKKDQELLTKYDELAQSIFYEMFGDPVRNERGWLTKTIRDIASDVKYGTSSPASGRGQYPYLRMNNITYKGELDLTELKYIDVSATDYAKYGTRVGDLLFNRTNSKELVGKTTVVDTNIPMVLAGYLIRVRLTEEANPVFVCSFLNCTQGKQILKSMCKSIIGMANINAQELQSIPIIVPPRELQNDYVERVNVVKKLKKRTHQGIQFSGSLFNQIMEKFFVAS